MLFFIHVTKRTGRHWCIYQTIYSIFENIYFFDFKLIIAKFLKNLNK